MLCAAALAVFPPQAEACTRAVYLGPDGMTVTGRTMDWREEGAHNIDDIEGSIAAGGRVKGLILVGDQKNAEQQKEGSSNQ